MNRPDRKRILVVDDEDQIIRFLCIKLKLSGYSVISTTSGLECLELAKIEKPDIILLDMKLPDLDGFGVLQKLCTFSNKPVIVVSSTELTLEQVRSMGATDFVGKPFNVDKLIERIAVILEPISLI